VASTLLREEAEEEGISFPTLRRAKKALRIQSHKREEEWDWQLPGLRVIPQPTPLVSVASCEPLEHVHVHQTVRGETGMTLGDAVVPEEGEGSLPCGCGHAHVPGACEPERVEKMEESQETQEVQEVEETPPAPTAPKLPMFCPCCHKKVKVWINRGAYLQCGNYKCPGKVWSR
jgi:hypothetical protein